MAAHNYRLTDVGTSCAVLLCIAGDTDALHASLPRPNDPSLPPLPAISSCTHPTPPDRQPKPAKDSLGPSTSAKLMNLVARAPAPRSRLMYGTRTQWQSWPPTKWYLRICNRLRAQAKQETSATAAAKSMCVAKAQWTATASRWMEVCHVGTDSLMPRVQLGPYRLPQASGACAHDYVTANCAARCAAYLPPCPPAPRTWALQAPRSHQQLQNHAAPRP
jgi:hypothetical protein